MNPLSEETQSPPANRWAIWDLDNCLTDDQHRIPSINWSLRGDARYEEYNSQMWHDSPRNLDVFQTVCRIARPVFFSGRPEKFRHVTESWIRTHLLKLDSSGQCIDPIVYLRQGEGRPAMIKHTMLWHHLRTFHLTPLNITAAFDDVPAVIEMYRREGVPAVLLQVHNPASAYQSEDLLPQPGD